MSPAEYFYKNFYSFALMLSGAPGGGRILFEGGSLAAASGNESAGENYAIFSGAANAADVSRCAAFFKERGAFFAAPLLPEAPAGFSQALESCGLSQKHLYTSMALPLGGKISSAAALEPIGSGSTAEWTEALWTAFGGNPADSAGIKDYVRLGNHLAMAAGNRALVLRSGGRIVTTALLHETQETLGLYYFATVPAFRRRGFARTALEALAAAAEEAKKPLTLLATEEGLKVYDSFGFKTIDKVPMFSASPDF